MIDHPDAVYLANAAKLGSSAKNVYVIDNFLPNEEYQTLSNFVNNSDQIPWIKEPWTTDRTAPNSIPEDCVKIIKKIYPLARLNCMDYYDIKVNDSRNYEHDVLLRKWSPGSKMNLHIDIQAQKNLHIIGMYYLNDDYEGGEIFFPDYNLKIKPKPNSLLMFPGNENYAHGVHEVTKGFRYTYQVSFVFEGSTFIGETKDNLEKYKKINYDPKNFMNYDQKSF